VSGDGGASERWPRSECGSGGEFRGAKRIRGLWHGDGGIGGGGLRRGHRRTGQGVGSRWFRSG